MVGNYNKKLLLLFKTCVLYGLVMINIDIGSSELFIRQNGVFEIIMLAGLYVLLKWKAMVNDKRGSLISTICGCMLSLCYVMGYNIEQYQDLWDGAQSAGLQFFLKFLGLSYLFSIVILGFFMCLNKLSQKEVRCRGKISLYLLICMLLIAAWLPTYYLNFPGILFGDSYNMIYQALGMETLSTHHPLIYVLLLKLAIHIMDTPDHAIIFCMAVSVVVNAVVLSYCIFYMMKSRWDSRVIGITIGLFMFYPSIQLFVFTISKDSFFASFVGMFTTVLVDVIRKTRLSKKQACMLAVSALGVVLFRKNGLYLVLFTLMGLLFLKTIQKKEKRKIIMICAGALLCNCLFETAAVRCFAVAKGSEREMLSLPLQQMARICKNVSTLSPQLREVINFYFEEGVDIGEEYYPFISDNVKKHFSEKNYSQNKLGIFKLAAQLFILYPKESLEAYMCQSYGYWYPTQVNWFGVTKKKSVQTYNTYISNHEYPDTVDFVYFADIKNYPVITCFTSNGLLFWMLLCIFFYLVYLKEFRFLIVLIPIATVWLTSVASPVWNEHRYVLSLYTVIPVVIGMLVDLIQKKRTGKGVSATEYRTSCKGGSANSIRLRGEK